MKVFISHASEDSRLAERVAVALRKRGLEAWADQDEVPVGGDSHRLAADALASSDAMIVLVSPQSMRSKWVQSEIAYALTRPRFEGRLIPLLVRRTPERIVPWVFERFEMTDLPTTPTGVARVVGGVTKRLRTRAAKPKLLRARDGTELGSRRARPEKPYGKVSESAAIYAPKARRRKLRSNVGKGPRV